MEEFWRNNAKRGKRSHGMAFLRSFAQERSGRRMSSSTLGLKRQGRRIREKRMGGMIASME